MPEYRLSPDDLTRLTDHMAALPDFQGRPERRAALSLAGLNRFFPDLDFAGSAREFCTHLLEKLATPDEPDALPALLRYLMRDLYAGRPDVLPDLQRMAARFPAAWGRCEVSLFEGVSLDEADVALLESCPYLSHIQVKTRVDEGKSGAVVLQAVIQFRNPARSREGGRVYIKIDDAARTQAEARTHDDARQGMEDFIPRLLGQIGPEKGRAAAIYQPATGTILGAKSLSKMLRPGTEDFSAQMAAQTLQTLCESALRGWGDQMTVGENSPRGWLLAGLNCGGRDVPPNGEGGRFHEVAALRLPPDKPTIRRFYVTEFDTSLPNPAAYALLPDLWGTLAKLDLGAPRGRVHGDFHAGNLVYHDSVACPALIDLARSQPDQPLFADLVYLELDILLNRLAGQTWRVWRQILPALALGIALDDAHEPADPHALAAWKILKPLRQHAQKLIEQVDSSRQPEARAVWWLVAAGVGLLFARREAYAGHDERLITFLYAAHCLQRGLDILRCPSEGVEGIPTLTLAARPEPPQAALRPHEVAYAEAVQTNLNAFHKIYVDLGGEKRAEIAEPVAPKPNPFSGLIAKPGLVDRSRFRPPTETKGEDGKPQPIPNVRDFMRAEDRIVLLGEPGAGKTWTLLRLTLDYADELAKSPTALIPVFVPLAQYVHDDWAKKGGLAGFVKDKFTEYGAPPALTAAFDALLKAGRLVFLCDALNEMPRTKPESDDPALVALRAFLKPASKAAVSTPVSEAAVSTPMCKVAVSCREKDFNNGDLAGGGRFGVVYLRDLTPPLIWQIIDNHLYPVTETLWEGLTDAQKRGLWESELQGNDLLLAAWQEMADAGHDDAFWRDADPPEPLLRDSKKWGWGDYPYDRRDEMRRIMLRHPKGLMLLCRNPYMLSMVITLYRDTGKLSDVRGTLFRDFANALFVREKLAAYEEQGKVIYTPDGQTLFDGLVRVGEHMQLTRGGVTTLSEAEALPIIGGEVMLRLAVQCSLLQRGGVIRFSHQLLQEYFASYGMARDMTDGVPASKYWPPDKWWETTKADQTARLLAGVQAAAGNLARFTRWLAPHQPELALDAAVEAVGATLQTAATALSAEGEHAPTRQILLDVCLAKIVPANERDPRGRAAAGRALAQIGDPRPGVLDFDIQCCDVPGGPFQMGGEAYDNEKPIHTVEVAAFQIAKYPVTYWQFQAFIDAPDGFNNPDWWAGLHEDGLNQQRGGPDNQYFKFWNHPCDNVSWYDAVAFCRWLSRNLGYEVRLPTEAEWEKAARWKGHRSLQYPYGDTYDPTKSNTRDTGIGQTSAVGIFPDGAAPCGAFDMSGNVWEWVSSKTNGYPYHADDGREDLTGNSPRRVRGGSWYDDLSLARAAYRYNLSPNNRISHVGFRVAVGPRPPSV